MTESTKIKTPFDLRTISIYVVIALIVGAGAGYMIGNSPLSSLIESKDWLEAEYDSLSLAVQSLEADLNSALELLVEEQRDNELLQERYVEMLAIDQENQVLKQHVMDLESGIIKLEYTYNELMALIPGLLESEGIAIPYLYWPSTHTAQIFKEIEESLELTWEVEPPPGEQYIDITDIFKLTVTVKNNYETPLLFDLMYAVRIIPTVQFKEVYVKVLGTSYAEVQNPQQDNMWALVTGEERLARGETATIDIYLNATSTKGIEWLVASVEVYADLDLETFFKSYESAGVRALIRPPPEP